MTAIINVYGLEGMKVLDVILDQAVEECQFIPRP